MGFDVLSKPRYLCVTCFYCLAVYKTQTGNASLSLCLTYLCTGRQVDGGESEGPPSGMPPCQPWANLQGLLPAQPQCLKPSVLGVCRPYRFLIFWTREMSVAAFSLATKIDLTFNQTAHWFWGRFWNNLWCFCSVSKELGQVFIITKKTEKRTIPQKCRNM